MKNTYFVNHPSKIGMTEEETDLSRVQKHDEDRNDDNFIADQTVAEVLGEGLVAK